MTSGLRIYFNKALGNNLLYRFERGQYSEQMKTLNIEEGRELSSIYGAEHLLRLFGQSPGISSLEFRADGSGNSQLA